ncbi:MAG: short-chain fatty acid transporter [Candidatus Latescibacterota bacterium]|nr:MAG: short-chain fatty acid transporter [Candidatus Latescibacterota bacterium]
MISQLGIAISGVFRRLMPEPFVLAILLTFVTLFLAHTLTGIAFPDLVRAWSGDAGVWALLNFGMQMCLILVTGHALASSPPVSALLERLTTTLRTPTQAVVLVALVATLFGVLNWGLGLIAGALMARRVGVAMQQRGVTVHYPLLCAAGYLGLLVWHGGFSGSAPLKVTQASEIQDLFGADAPFAEIPLTETILSGMNLFVTGGLLLLAPLLVALLTPRPGDAQTPDRFVDTAAAPGPVLRTDKPALPRLLEDTPILTLLLVLLIGVWAWGFYFPTDLSQSGIKRLTPNSVNLTMLMLGLIMHRTPARYVRAIDDAVRGCAGIILQFPLYAGIMGVMKASGLTALLAERIAATTSATTLPILTFFSAAIVNLFVPSGGGQWAVQGPIAMHAGIEAGVPAAKMVMSVAYGDQLTNMLQPFWALPLLSITGVKARDIVGYTALVMLFACAWILLGLALF